ncbi:unnamed protein product [Arabidopsis halleri]
MTILFSNHRGFTTFSPPQSSHRRCSGFFHIRGAHLDCSLPDTLAHSVCIVPLR